MVAFAIFLLWVSQPQNGNVNLGTLQPTRSWSNQVGAVWNRELACVNLCTSRTGWNPTGTLHMPKTNSNVKEVFKAAVNQRLLTNPNQWTGEGSVAVVRALVVNINDDQGNPISPTADEIDVMTIASRPTHDLHMKVIKTIIARHNGKLDPTTEGLIDRVVSAGAFKLELVKAGKIKSDDSDELSGMLD